MESERAALGIVLALLLAEVFCSDGGGTTVVNDGKVAGAFIDNLCLCLVSFLIQFFNRAVVCLA